MSTAIAPQPRTAPEVTITLADDWEDRIKEIEARFRKLDDKQLIEALAEKFSLTAQQFVECAVLVRIAEERGIDTSPIANGWSGYLRRVAYGQMIPELMTYSSRIDVIDRAAQLAIPDQRQLVSQGMVEFADGEDGKDVRLVDPRTATKKQLKQIFNHDRMRPIHEQRRWLQEKSGSKKSRRVKPSVTRASEVSDDEMTVEITIAVTTEWDAMIRTMAKENKRPVKFTGTRFLIALGKK